MFQIILRTIFFYFFIIVSYRIMGKREVGQLGIIDLIVSILIAELVAISIENYKSSIFLTIFPITILVILEIFLGFASVKSRKLNRLLGGKPTILINKGILNYKNLISQRYSLDDLLIELRQKEIYSIEDVEYALLEPNVKLSIFKKKLFQKNSPLPIIIEGIIQKESLQEIEKNETWLLNQINKNNLNLKEIFYCVYKNNHLYIIKNPS